MKTEERSTRANQEEIFAHLYGLLGEGAVQTAEQTAVLIKQKQNQEGLELLKSYDSTLGGVGIYSSDGKKPESIYRSFAYVEMPLRFEHSEEFTRGMIQSSCAYLEALLKKKVRLWPWETIRSDYLPLGTLIKKIEKRLPDHLRVELDWLNRNVYNYAKHHYNLEENENDEPEHYFELEEAIAVYLIVRKLGLEVEEWFEIIARPA